MRNWIAGALCVGPRTYPCFRYDPVGNRLSSLGVASYTNNTSNELTATSNASYSYDLNGNVATKNNSTGITTYAWDFENRMTSLTLPASGGTVSFKYDPFGRRIYKSSSTATSVYAYDGDNLIEETNASGAVVARYSQGLNIDEPLAMLRSSATSFYHADGLGSITSLANGAGALAQTYTFDSFGKQTASTGSLTTPFQYTGRESDPETGLYYYRARYYDAATGRFLSEDPLGTDGGGFDFYRFKYYDPMARSIPREVRTGFRGGLNFYRYATGNPANFNDPFGLWPSSGDVWNWGKRAKGAWDKAKSIAGRIDCFSTYWNCVMPTLSNSEASNKASGNDVRNTLHDSDFEHPKAALGLKNVQDCIAGNPNCGKKLEDCLSGVVAGGIFP
jgi:RHS repeat-associated protein